MWPIWEWFVDVDSYAVWADCTGASSRPSVSPGPVTPEMDCDSNVTPYPCAPFLLADEIEKSASSSATAILRLDSGSGNDTVF